MSLSVNNLFYASLQSPGQYYFKPMMKEFRFEPSSQMIEVQEGQNLKIQITGYRTAYRSVELKCLRSTVYCSRMHYANMCLLPVHLCSEGLEGSSEGTIQLHSAVCESFFVLFLVCGYVATPRTVWRNIAVKALHQWHWKWLVLCPVGEQRAVLGMVDQFRYLTSTSFLSLPSGVSSAPGGQGAWNPEAVL